MTTIGDWDLAQPALSEPSDRRFGHGATESFAPAHDTKRYVRAAAAFAVWRVPLAARRRFSDIALPTPAEEISPELVRFWRTLAADAGFYVLILGYGLATFLASVILGDAKWFVPLLYAKRWIGAIGLLAAIAACVCLWRARGASDRIAAAADEFRTFCTPERLGGMVLFTCMGVFYGVFTSAKMMMPEFAPFTWDHALADIDRALHGDDPWRYLQWLQSYDAIVRMFYGHVWFTLLSLGALVLCVTQVEFRRQYLWTFFVAWILLGNVMPMMFMAGGPIYFEGLTDDPRFAELSDRIFAQGDINDPSSLYPQVLWEAFMLKQPGVGTGISAFPSLHVSMATLFALAAFRLSRRAGLVMSAYLLFIMAGSVHLGWHYAIDGYVSLVVTVAMWKLFGYRLRRCVPTAAARSSSVIMSGKRIAKVIFCNWWADAGDRIPGPKSL
jgi:hypothetical protein